MFILHPLIQLTALVITLYVLQLGVARFRRSHLNHKTTFKWQRHVKLGTTAMVLLLVGTVIGLIVVKYSWDDILISGEHGHMIFIIIPLVLMSLGSGWYMNKRKKPRVFLPVFHAIINLFLIVLVFFQAFSGWHLYQAFVGS